MTVSFKLSTLAGALVVCSTATAQDECTTAVALGLGTTAFDTTAATTSPEPWPCGTGMNDIWYTFTAPNTALYGFSTCANASFDTTIEIFTGTCGALVSLACNDDACGTQSGASAAANAGDVLIVRIGGWQGATGTGDLEVVEVLPRTPSCLSTVYASNNVGAVGGGTYFTLTTTQAITIDSIRANLGQPLGTPVGMQIWQAPAGTTPDGAGWVQVGMDDGSATSLGGGNPTPIPLAAPVPIGAGAHAIAMIGIGTEHRYTNGTGTNQSYTDGVVTLDLGMATNAPFTAPVFDPRVWNGTICYSGSAGPIGTPDTGCVSLPSSAGAIPNVSLVGTGLAGDDIDAELTSGPPNEFGYWIAGPTTAVIPAGCGFICIGSPQYRYKSVGGGELFQFDAAGVSQTVGGSGPNVLVTDGTSPSGVPAAAVGLTWGFQGWYRDAGCTTMGQEYNFSDSVRVTFQ